MLRNSIQKEKINYDFRKHLDNIRGALQDAGVDMKGKAGEVLSNYYDQIEEKAAKAKENVVDYVENEPFKAVGIALVAGIIFGYLLRR